MCDVAMCIFVELSGAPFSVKHAGPQLGNCLSRFSCRAMACSSHARASPILCQQFMLWSCPGLGSSWSCEGGAGDKFPSSESKIP